MNNSKMQDLPILKHFEQSQIGKATDSFRKGEKGLFHFMKLAAIGGLGYLTWVYVLPPLFIALGQALAIGGTIAVAVFMIAMIPMFLKGLRRFTRFVHKSIIKHDPFGELAEQRKKLLQNQLKFRQAQGNISGLRTDMQISAAESQEKAEAFQKKIVSLYKKSEKIKSEMKEIENKLGVKAKADDTYVDLHSSLMKTLSEATRITHLLNQEKDFVLKYGSRGAIMKKFEQKLKMVGTAMDIKILDFDATVEILQKDYEFAKKSKEATSTAKSAMLFTHGWEVEFALDVVTTTIAQDIAITTGNLQDIDSITSMYNLDSDELYTNLESLANNINTGKDLVEDASKFNQMDYKLTQEEKISVGKFGDMY